jgi:hypothetical protein
MRGGEDIWPVGIERMAAKSGEERALTLDDLEDDCLAAGIRKIRLVIME